MRKISLFGLARFITTVLVPVVFVLVVLSNLEHEASIGCIGPETTWYNEHQTFVTNIVTEVGYISMFNYFIGTPQLWEPRKGPVVDDDGDVWSQIPHADWILYDKNLCGQNPTRRGKLALASENQIPASLVIV